MPTAKKKGVKITDRDYKLFRFLWKWKAVSTRAIASKFFPEAESFTAYKRLLQLADCKYILTYSVEENSAHQVWGLDKKGFQYILPYLGDLELNGYKSSSPTHDYFASAFQLGEWLINQPKDTQTYSEQQLLCYPVELWPEWIPTSKLHRPDGYTAIDRDNQRIIIAFETELTPKSKRRYENLTVYYDTQSTIYAVFWLVDSKTTLNAVRSGFKKFNVRDWAKHQFILLKDFMQFGWKAEFIEGKFKGKTIADFMILPPHTNPTQSPLGSVTLSLLDSQKRPAQSTTSK